MTLYIVGYYILVYFTFRFTVSKESCDLPDIVLVLWSPRLHSQRVKAAQGKHRYELLFGSLSVW